MIRESCGRSAGNRTQLLSLPTACHQAPVFLPPAVHRMHSGRGLPRVGVNGLEPGPEVEMYRGRERAEACIAVRVRTSPNLARRPVYPYLSMKMELTT